MKKLVTSIVGEFALSKEAIDFMVKRGNKIAKKELELAIKDYKKITVALYRHKIRFLNMIPYGRIFKLTKYRQDPDLIAAVEELGEKAWYDNKLAIFIPYYQSSRMYFKIKYNQNLNGEDVIMCHRQGFRKNKIQLSHRSKLM